VVQAATPPPQAPVAQQTSAAPVDPASAGTPPVAQPESTAATSPAVTPPADPQKPESGRLSVGLSATERTWVSLSSDGKTVFSGVLDASQTKNIEGVENAKLTTGNAAGLDVRWNGKSIGPLGTHGQVRVVVFTPENFQILSPRKM